MIKHIPMMNSRLDQSTYEHEQFEPSLDMVTEDECDTILLFLPGSQKNNIRVQVTKNRKLKISGQCPVGEGKLRFFEKEFQISENCDINGITAKCEDDILYIRQPKVKPALAEGQKKDNGKQNNVDSPEKAGSTPKEEPVHNKSNWSEPDKQEGFAEKENNSGPAKQGDENYNQVLTALVMEMKNRRKIFNFLMVALLLAFILGFYSTTWIE